MRRSTASREEPAEEILDRAHADDLDVARRSLRYATLAEKDPRHSHVRPFSNSTLGLRHGAHLAPEPYLADEDRVARKRSIVDARRERSRHRQIARWFLQSHAAHDVEKDVELGEREPGALVEHGEQQCQTTTIEAGGDPLRRS